MLWVAVQLQHLKSPEKHHFCFDSAFNTILIVETFVDPGEAPDFQLLETLFLISGFSSLVFCIVGHLQIYK